MTYIKLFQVLPQCKRYLLNNQILPLTKQNESEYLAESYEIGSKGLRVLAIAKGKSLNDLVYLGIVGITDPPRPLVRESIEILNRSGVRVKMVTGDSQETALAVGEFFLLIISYLEIFICFHYNLKFNFCSLISLLKLFISHFKVSVG